MNSRLCLSVAALLISACGSREQAAIEEVQFGLTTAAAVGRTSALAMDAMKGTATVCATVKTACTTYPCTTGAVTIQLGSGCPLPLGGAATGTITVTGSWQSADQATLSQSFASTQVTASENKSLAIASVQRVSVQRSSSSLSVSYSGADAVAGASGSAVAVGASSSWQVAVDTKGTADPADDVVTINASSASGSAGGLASARAATISSAVLDPGCRQNPISGSANITEVSGFIPTITKIQFHAACDGKVEVNGTTQDFKLLP